MPIKDPEERRAYNRAWTRARRQEYIDAQGNECAKCGAVGVPFDVDHIDPKTKTIPVRAIWNRRKEVREAELAKCQLLCEPCHQQKTDKENSVPLTHGDYQRGYSKGCKCSLCMESMRKRWREYRSRPEVAQRRLRPATTR